MSSSTKMNNSVMRDLPSVDELLRTSSCREIILEVGEEHAKNLCRNVIEQLRGEIAKPTSKVHSKASLLALSEQRVLTEFKRERSSGVRRVINATGVVIHTNLGRAPLSENARRAIVDSASGYCTLEYNVQTGKRGPRGRRAEILLAELTGAEDVLIVNNCAAAAFFVLIVYASGGEVIISRGELVEIGGDFRVPDVLKQSRAKLHEVGTTNRTKITDYENAINSKTKLILRVHPSNYRIVGFTATPSIDDLAEIAHEHELLLYEDIGSGALIDLKKAGLQDEPIISHSIGAGADIVTFSGDKLLGGPQAGIIAGKKKLIDRLRKHPLFRALRIDKLAYAGLEGTLIAYQRHTAIAEIPVLKMLSMSKNEIAKRVNGFAARLTDRLGENSKLNIEIIDGRSAVGGGAAPAVPVETTLLALSHHEKKAQRLEQQLRSSDTPVIARIIDAKVTIDLRTVSETEETELSEAICAIA